MRAEEHFNTASQGKRGFRCLSCHLLTKLVWCVCTKSLMEIDIICVFCLFIARLLKESLHTEVKTRFCCQNFNYSWQDKRKMTLTNDWKIEHVVKKKKEKSWSVSPEQSTFQFEVYSPKRWWSFWMKLRELIKSFPVFFFFRFVSCLYVLCPLVFDAMLSFVCGGEADSEAIAFETFVKIIIIT